MCTCFWHERNTVHRQSVWVCGVRKFLSDLTKSSEIVADVSPPADAFADRCPHTLGRVGGTRARAARRVWHRVSHGRAGANQRPVVPALSPEQRALPLKSMRKFGVCESVGPLTAVLRTGLADQLPSNIGRSVIRQLLARQLRRCWQ